MFGHGEQALLYNSLVGFGLILIWFGALLVAKPHIYRLQRTTMNLSDNQLDLIHAWMIGIFKILILTLYFVPWLAAKMS